MLQANTLLPSLTKTHAYVHTYTCTHITHTHTHTHALSLSLLPPPPPPPPHTHTHAISLSLSQTDTHTPSLCCVLFYCCWELVAIFSDMPQNNSQIYRLKSFQFQGVQTTAVPWVALAALWKYLCTGRWNSHTYYSFNKEIGPGKIGSMEVTNLTANKRIR